MDTKLIITDTEDGIDIEQFFKKPDKNKWEKNPEMNLNFRELGRMGAIIRMSEFSKDRGRELKHHRRLSEHKKPK